jgi:hypothetical protein
MSGILVADASGTLRRVPPSATASMSTHRMAGQVTPCTACKSIAIKWSLEPGLVTNVNAVGG